MVISTSPCASEVPAPLKLRPNGAIQIYYYYYYLFILLLLLLLLLLLFVIISTVVTPINNNLIHNIHKRKVQKYNLQQKSE